MSDTTREPVAWAVLEPDGFGIEGTFTDRDEACEWCDDRQEIVPLYRAPPPPALTAAERATLYHLRNWLRLIPDVDALLARLSGDA